MRPVYAAVAVVVEVKLVAVAAAKVAVMVAETVAAVAAARVEVWMAEIESGPWLEHVPWATRVL
jgi:hypothetical protein